MDYNLIYLPARELIKKITAKEVSAVEVMNAFLSQIKKHNPAVNALCDMRSENYLLEEAAKSDQLLDEGEPGPLHGLPITVKDNFWVKGLKVSNGHPGFRNFVATEDAELIKRLKDAGAIIVGKTNVPLFSIDWQATNFWNGTTNNPYDLRRVPGGSSGGAAAAVAAGFSPLELGGDQGGSIRVPAHFCGICGMRPTEYALSNKGHIRFPGKPQGHRQVTVAGPLARNVDDLLLIMEVLWDHARYPLAEIPPVSFNNTSWDGTKLKIAVSEAFNGVEIDHEYLSLFRVFVEKVSLQGHTFVNDYPRYDEEKAYATCGKITGYEFDINLPRLPLSKAMMYAFIRLKYRDKRWAQGVSQGIGISAKAYAQTLAHKDHVSNIYHIFFGDYDVWITPVAAMEAFVHRRAGKPLVVNRKKVAYTKAIASYTFTTALSGHPIVVIPIGRKSNGMPVGVQIHARKWTDKRLLEIARHFETLTEGFVAPDLTR